MPSSFPLNIVPTTSTIPQSTPKPEKKVPRPKNAFIIFRQEFVKHSKSYRTGMKQQELSQAAGVAWKALPDSQKAYWNMKADEEREEHKKKHPLYRYTPTRRSQKLKPKVDEVTSSEAATMESLVAFITARVLSGQTSTAQGSAVAQPQPQQPQPQSQPCAQPSPASTASRSSTSSPLYVPPSLAWQQPLMSMSTSPSPSASEQAVRAMCQPTPSPSVPSSAPSPAIATPQPYLMSLPVMPSFSPASLSPLIACPSLEPQNLAGPGLDISCPQAYGAMQELPADVRCFVPPTQARTLLTTTIASVCKLRWHSSKSGRMSRSSIRST
jgi:hypothetical protein